MQSVEVQIAKLRHQQRVVKILTYVTAVIGVLLIICGLSSGGKSVFVLGSSQMVWIGMVWVVMACSWKRQYKTVALFDKPLSPMATPCDQAEEMSQGGRRATGNMHRTRALIVGIFCLMIGIGAGYAYQAWQFKYKAFGHKIEYGILSPEYAYAQLLKSRNRRARDASLMYIVDNRKQSHPVIAGTLDAVFGQKKPESIPPMAALAMGRFDLNAYLEHPNSNQRLAAVGASRWWNATRKIDVLRKFLDDPDKSVVDQTIYELGYIGDPSVLDILSESRFDNHAFIEKVRQALKTGETFR